MYSRTGHETGRCTKRRPTVRDNAAVQQCNRGRACVEQRRFGATDLIVSAVGFGTWPIGNTGNYGRSDDDEAMNAVRAALDAGVTCFDTAANYGGGHSEELLGTALGARRRDIVLVTKGGIVFDPAGKTIRRDSGREHLTWCIESSLARLGTEYLDLFLIHWPDTGTPMAEAMETMAGFVRAGKTRYIGVSNFNAAQVQECLDALPDDVPLVTEQVGYNLFDRRWEREVFPLCGRNNVGIMAYGPLAHGLLAGAYTKDSTFEAADWRASGNVFGQPLLAPGNFGRNLAVVDALTAMATRHGTTLPQLALAWVLANRAVTVALVGARTPAELEAAIATTNTVLSPEMIAELDTIMEGAAGQTTAVPG